MISGLGPRRKSFADILQFFRKDLSNLLPYLAALLAIPEEPNIHHQSINGSSMDYGGHVSGAYPVKMKLNAGINNHIDTASNAHGDGQYLNNLLKQVGCNLNSPLADPCFLHHLQKTSDYSMHAMASPSDPSQLRNFSGASHGELEGPQKAYLEALLVQQKLLHLGKSGSFNYGFHGNHRYGPVSSYSGSQMENSALPSLGSGKSSV
ncbi:putative Pumilio [Quillaja saponaria]|uniref:Pumilio n=1 Tax=Quillaja saponaria TaxID=32244 RepID=A0AAD7VGJ5_QUISA|nr:putative Pumilio [Quillaja saponaria]